MAGLHVSSLKLTDMRMVVFGAGTAGTGIADQVRDAIAADSGKSKEEAAKQIWYACLLPLFKLFFLEVQGVWANMVGYTGVSTNPASS